MRRRNTISLGDAIQEFIKAKGWDVRIAEMELMEHYAEIMGPEITAYTRRKFLKEGTVFLDLISGIAKSEVMMNKSLFVARFNEAAGRLMVFDIKLL